LRIAEGLTLEELAERTKYRNFAQIDKLTIWRLEHGAQTQTRNRTITQLAHALNVERAILLGEAPLPERQRSTELNIPISTGAHNALYLVGLRYNITQREVLELAPFLFCWAAEASLLKRRDQVRQLELACENARNAELAIRHLSSNLNSPNTEGRITAECESIKNHDLFGTNFEDESMVNPFALFLHDLTNDMGDVATFEKRGCFDNPVYRVCPEEAALLVDRDNDLVDEIFAGHVALDEMPKELQRGWGMCKERVEWVRSKAEEYRRELSREFEKFRVKHSSEVDQQKNKDASSEPAHYDSPRHGANGPGRPRLKGQPSSRTGENPPYGMIAGIEETSASFSTRARSCSGSASPTWGPRSATAIRWPADSRNPP
jgi:transcriptional regulator with XRE-family HTH domain